jgi:hypothetical protein
VQGCAHALRVAWRRAEAELQIADTPCHQRLVRELQQLRPHLSLRMLNAFATMRWPSDKDGDLTGPSPVLSRQPAVVPGGSEGEPMTRTPDRSCRWCKGTGYLCEDI